MKNYAVLQFLRLKEPKKKKIMLTTEFLIFLNIEYNTTKVNILSLS